MPQASVTFESGGEWHTITLNDEFKKAIEVMEDSSENIFITGKAGTGKSMLLKYFCSQTSKRVAVLAPTGLAAINVAGQTIHSFFRLPPRLIQANEIKYNRKVADLVKNIDTIIIDEVSMVRADIMEGIDISLRKYKKKNIPFGGMQMIFFGDLFQLPPIVHQDLQEYFIRHYETPYFFSAKVFSESAVYAYKLQKVHRQKDEIFISLLNNIREGNDIEDTVNDLNQRHDDAVEHMDPNKAVILTGTNDRAKNHNDRFMARIPGPTKSYQAKLKGKFKADGPYLGTLELKVGAKVLFIKNDTEGRWVNGDFGNVMSLGEKQIEVEIKGETFTVKPEKWEAFQYVTKEDGEKINVEKDTIGSASQFPLKPGWAITIHKSQGQTFDNIILDLGRYGTFAFGQLYVALSRARSLEGIYLKELIKYTDVKVDAGLLDAELNLLRKSIHDIQPPLDLFSQSNAEFGVSGFCISCATRIAKDKDRYFTLCKDCYLDWTVSGYDEYAKMNFCHFCGAKSDITKDAPVCSSCS